MDGPESGYDLACGILPVAMRDVSCHFENLWT